MMDIVKGQDPAPDTATTNVVTDDYRIRSILITFLTALFAIIIGNLVFTLSQARQHVLDSQNLISGKLVQVLEQQTADSVNALELALQSSARTIERMLPREQANHDVIQEMLASSIRQLPFVRAIWVLDAQGNMIYDSERLPGKYNLADRDYFKIQQANPAYGLYIDTPQLSKHGVWFIGVSLRINRPDGSFAGVIAAAFEPRHFRHFYESIQIGHDGVVSLLGLDGTLMLRVPEVPGIEGKKLSPLPKFIEQLPAKNAGGYRNRSSVDNVDRVYFYRRVAGRPLVVLVGISEAEALATWRNTAQAYTAVSLAFLFLVAWLAYLSLHELHRRTRLNRSLRERESDLAAAQRLSRTGSWEVDVIRKTGRWSDEMYSLFGLQKKPTPPPLHEFANFIHPEDQHLIEAALKHGMPWSGELRTNPAHGPVRYLYSSGTEVFDAKGEVVCIRGTLQDVTERRQAEDKLRVAAEVFNHIQDAILVVPASGVIDAVNDAFVRITGFNRQEVIGQHPSILRSDRHDERFYDSIWQEVQDHGKWRGEIWGKRKSGEAFPQWVSISVMRDDRGLHTGYLAVLTDLSEIKEANAQLMFLTNHDPLTRLPNRRLLNDRLEQVIDSAGASKKPFAVLILNIDRLQRINDSIGHDAGDTILCAVSKHLLSKIPHGDTLARPGSDEFVAVFTRFGDNNELITFAHQLLDAAASSITLDERVVSMTASMGISVFPQDGQSASELLKNADSALSHAKQRGPGSMQFFTSEMNARAVHWLSLEHALREAMVRDELELYYQPQCCIADGTICGVEALLRWNSAHLGKRLPSEFIPIAEDTGLIVPIGEWVIHTACAQAKAWQDDGFPPMTVAVNVSGIQLSAGTLCQTVRQALQLSGLAPEYLEIELTESVLMQEAESAIQQLNTLKELGVRVSLDDFGTGYSSLSYLSRFNINKLKIDQSFVRNITTDERSAAITRATITLAHGLGISVIAEGVEHDEQLAKLCEFGCDEIQGFLLGKPAPAEELSRTWLSRETNPMFAVVKSILNRSR